MEGLRLLGAHRSIEVKKSEENLMNVPFLKRLKSFLPTRF
jgi:hypothetical protein